MNIDTDNFEVGFNIPALVGMNELDIQTPCLILDLDALEMTELRGLAAMREGKRPGAESSLLKIKGTELQQRISTLAVEVSGHDAMPYGGPYGFSDVEVAATKDAQLSAPKYLNFRKVTIYGGTNEIQKNIIAKAVLGI